MRLRWGGGENPIDGELLPYGILSGGGSMGGGGSHVTLASIALTEKVAENIVIWEILDWVHIISKVLMNYIFYINYPAISKH